MGLGTGLGMGLGQLASSSRASRSSTQSTSLVLYPRSTWVNLTASTSAPVTPYAGSTVAVVPRGSGGSCSPRPNSRLAAPNSTIATSTSTTRYSNTNATSSILPYAAAGPYRGLAGP
jgi:hypothetical protein